MRKADQILGLPQITEGNGHFLGATLWSAEADADSKRDWPHPKDLDSNRLLTERARVG